MNTRIFAAALSLTFAAGCSADWPMFRHNLFRTGQQLNRSPLSDPAQVASLAVRWTFTAPGNTPFRASPVVSKGRVLIGNSNGRFYALDWSTGAQLWVFPPATQPALTSQYTCNPSSQGIASSAAVATIGGTEAVIFGAPDQSVGTHLGESRLFALNAATGALIWASPVVGRLTGTTSSSTTQLHEQIGYSSPLVVGDSVYVGLADHCDNPIQKGRVAKVMLATGAVDGAFSYCSTGTCGDGTRGGGVWSPNAAIGDGVFVTTGNTRRGLDPEPVPNHGLSLLRLDRQTGAISWAFQPVPFSMDADPDWAAPPTVMLSSCGTQLVSTQKDGWTHALDEATGARRWSYPPPPAGIPFSPTDGTSHGDTRYMRGGAAWGDVYVTGNGGLNLVSSGVSGGYRRLHAFNACASPATPANLLRWLIDIPGVSGAYSVGNISVTGGLFYVGTSTGHLLVIADPSVVPAVGLRCANPDVSNLFCTLLGYARVPEPAIIKDVTLSGNIVYTEPALAGGRVFVSTEAGNVYMLSP